LSRLFNIVPSNVDVVFLIFPRKFNAFVGFMVVSYFSKFFTVLVSGSGNAKALPNIYFPRCGINIHLDFMMQYVMGELRLHVIIV
jgi:hypothetical protein